MEEKVNLYFTETALVAAARIGDQGAFAELYRRNTPRLSRVIYAITRNDEDAEDALQESVLNAFLNLHRFDGRSSFSTWLHRIGVNAALMLLRKRRQRSYVSIDGMKADGEEWLAFEPPDPGRGPEEQFASEQAENLLKIAIDRLPEPYQVVATMRIIKESSIEEIAEALGISKAAAKARLSRSRPALRKALTTGQKYGRTRIRPNRSLASVVDRKANAGRRLLTLDQPSSLSE